MRRKKMDFWEKIWIYFNLHQFCKSYYTNLRLQTDLKNGNNQGPLKYGPQSFARKVIVKI